MLIVVRADFRDIETNEMHHPFDFMDVSEERAESLITRGLALAVPLIAPEVVEEAPTEPDPEEAPPKTKSK